MLADFFCFFSFTFWLAIFINRGELCRQNISVAIWIIISGSDLVRRVLVFRLTNFRTIYLVKKIQILKWNLARLNRLVIDREPITFQPLYIRFKQCESHKLKWKKKTKKKLYRIIIVLCYPCVNGVFMCTPFYKITHTMSDHVIRYWRRFS